MKTPHTARLVLVALCGGAVLVACGGPDADPETLSQAFEDRADAAFRDAGEEPGAATLQLDSCFAMDDEGVERILDAGGLPTGATLTDVVSLQGAVDDQQVSCSTDEGERGTRLAFTVGTQLRDADQLADLRAAQDFDERRLDDVSVSGLDEDDVLLYELQGGGGSADQAVWASDGFAVALAVYSDDEVDQDAVEDMLPAAVDEVARVLGQ